MPRSDGYFKPGHKHAVGRPAGSINKRSVAFFQSVEEEGFDAAKAMVDIYQKAKKIFDNYAVIYDALEDARIAKGENPYPTEDKADKYLKIALDAAKDIASYCYPKPRFPDTKNQKPLENMSAQEKIEALKEAQKLLELEIKNNGSK